MRRALLLRSYVPCPASGNPHSVRSRMVSFALRVDKIARLQPFPFEIDTILVGQDAYTWDELLKENPALVPALDLEIRFRYVGDNPLGEEFVVEVQGEPIH